MALSTSGVLEQLAKHRRYRTSVIRRDGLPAYNSRTQALCRELIRRGVQARDDSEPPELALCRLRPLADHVVILPDVVPDVTAGGIVLVETAKEKPVQGTVLAVGPGRVEPGIGTILPAVQTGDVILFGRYAGVEVTLDEQRVLIMREEDVLGVLTPPEA